MVGIGSYLWSWQRAQATVRPRKPRVKRVDAVGVLVVLLGVAVVDRPAGEEAQGRQAVEPFGLGSVEQVAGDLLEDEPVVGQVAVEGADQPVAIAVAVGIEPGLERVGLVLAVPGDVEPVPAPALAVVRRGQQPVDDPGEGVGRIIAEEGRDLLGGRRQADQVEGDAADQGRLVGRRRRRQSDWPRAGRG